MKEYYYEEKGEQKGPVSLEELKERVTSDTKIWREGLKDWVEAKNLPELEGHLSSVPPPLNRNTPPLLIPPNSFWGKHKWKIISVSLIFISISLWILKNMSDRIDYESYRNNEMHKVRANWKDYILLSNAEPEIDYTFGGINSFPVYLYNRSIYRVDIVEVIVYYIKQNGDIYKTEKLSFHNLRGGEQLTLYAPSSERGTEVQCVISYIKSNQLELDEFVEK